MPNNIYTSEKVLPYVYFGVHKETAQFYIGYRAANKVPSNQDLGIKYFTSSKIVRPKFKEYNWKILAEFFTKEDAFIFEQELIKKHINDPLNLNQFIEGKWSRLGAIFSDEHRRKLSESHIGKVLKPFSKEHCQNISKGLIGKKLSDNHKLSISNTLMGHKHSEETKYKISEGNKGENNAFYGKEHSDATKNLMSIKAKNRPKIQCTYCKRLFSICNFTQYHGDKCKLKS